MATTFTVPATAIYEDAETGQRTRFHLNDVIDIVTAVRFGMPGASLPALTTPFTDAQDDWLDDLITDANLILASDITDEVAAAVALEDIAGQVATAFSASTVNTLRGAAARTATADGTGTGTIAVGTDFVTVTSDSADKIIVLPTPTPKLEVTLRNGATGYELRSSAPDTVAINGGTGTDAESAIGANVVTVCRCVLATAWVCTDYSTAGVVSATEVAAP